MGLSGINASMPLNGIKAKQSKTTKQKPWAGRRLQSLWKLKENKYGLQGSFPFFKLTFKDLQSCLFVSS